MSTLETVKQALITLTELSRVCEVTVVQLLVLCVVFDRSLFVLLLHFIWCPVVPFFNAQFIVCSFKIYGF